MSMVKVGNACAHIPGIGGEKSRYIKIGNVFREGERLAIKIDALPLPSFDWPGWINIFEDDYKPE